MAARDDISLLAYYQATIEDLNRRISIEREDFRKPYQASMKFVIIHYQRPSMSMLWL
jgi:hypothetical protein